MADLVVRIQILQRYSWNFLAAGLLQIYQRKRKVAVHEIIPEHDNMFGQSYKCRIEELRSSDAEIVLVASGSAAGKAWDVKYTIRLV